MLKIRTDLACEAHQLWRESAGETTRLKGVRAREGTAEGFPAERVEILDEEGAAAIGKPVGTYLSLDLTACWRREPESFPRAAAAVASLLTSLVPEEGPVLVAGLGNAAMTADALGPRTAGHLLVTRHLGAVLPMLRPVAALAAGVLGTTGVESGELAAAVAAAVRPARVVAVDALASRSLSRLCRTVQIADTGIVPGSGVGNARAALNKETLGVPVIAVGVPTVVDAATLCADVLAEAGRPGLDPGALGSGGRGVIVTPREIDSQVADISKVIGYGLSLALQEGLTVDDVEMFLS